MTAGVPRARFRPVEPTPDPLEQVRAAASLARLDLEGERGERLAADLERILNAFRTLEQVPVEGVEPLVTPHAPRDGLRADEPRPSLPAERLLERAPATEDDHYRVPRALP